MNKTFLSIGLCVYNKEKEVSLALESLINQSISLNLFEIIVIDNNSTDNTAQVVLEFINQHSEYSIKYIKEANQGVSFARNRAYLEASGDYVVYFDDDEIADESWLENYFLSIEKYPQAVILAGKVLVEYADSDFAAQANEYIDKWFAAYDYGDEDIVLSNELIERGKVDYPIAGNMAIKVSYLKQIGGFDTNLGRSKGLMLGGEETKLTKDALNSGLPVVYVPQSVVRHVVIKERCSLDFLKIKHFQQGMTFVLIHFADVSRFKRIRMVVYQLFAIVLRSFRLLFSPCGQRNFIALKNSFSLGIIHQSLFSIFGREL